MILNRTISATIALISIGATAVVSGGQEAMAVALGMMTSLVFIWWGDELGSMTGNVFSLSYVTATTPGVLLRLFGWGLLLAMVTALIIGSR